MMWRLVQLTLHAAPSAPAAPADVEAAPAPVNPQFPQVDPAQSEGLGIEFILILFGAVLTIGLLVFFIYVFTRKNQ